MFILGIGTATPAGRFTKAQCLSAFEKSDWFARLDDRAHLIARTVLQRDNGIEARRLAVDSLDEVFTIDPNTLSRRFATHAPALAAQAARRALAKAGLEPAQIDAVVVSTCTGYLCPGLSGHVVERIGLRADVQAIDLVGQGCAAALPNLQLSRAILTSGAPEYVLSICVEVSSAAMYLDNDPGVLISACLFGDGAGAAVVSRRADQAGRRIEWKDSASLIEPAQRNALMFTSTWLRTLHPGARRSLACRASASLCSRLESGLRATPASGRGIRPCRDATPSCHAVDAVDPNLARAPHAGRAMGRQGLSAHPGGAVWSADDGDCAGGQIRTGDPLCNTRPLRLLRQEKT